MRGGLGSEYYVSLKTGEAVLAALPRDRYEPHDILITQAGEWHLDGAPTTPARLAQQVDIVFNALHGEFGEDGKVQKILEQFNIPYTGSSSLPSAIGMNKELAKRRLNDINVRVPSGVTVSRGEDVEEVLARIDRTLKGPYIVKPLTGGSSLGVSFAETHKDLKRALEQALGYAEQALVEEYVKGREITVGVIDAPDGETSYLVAPLEILLPEGAVFDYDKKYRTPHHPLGPARLHDAERRALEEAVLASHKALDIRHYARYDVILTDKGPVVLEVNTLPGMYETSLFVKSLEHHGLSLSEFLDYVIALALEKK